jgi:hypothetical protein
MSTWCQRTPTRSWRGRPKFRTSLVARGRNANFLAIEIDRASQKGPHSRSLLDLTAGRTDEGPL